MCLDLNDRQNVRHTAKADIKVWKVLKESNTSIYFPGCKWIEGETKSSPMQEPEKMSIYYARNSKYRVSVGLHAFVDRVAAERFCLPLLVAQGPEKVVAMTIPKRTDYYFNDETEEVVTSALRWEKE